MNIVDDIPDSKRLGLFGDFAKPSDKVLVSLLFLHAGLALLCQAAPLLGTVHAIATFALIVYWAILPASLAPLAAGIGYLLGGEVLWRMINTQIPWEFAKYVASLGFMIAMLRQKTLNVPAVPMIYLLLLVPAMLISYFVLPLSSFRDELSFNLSGPLSLAISAAFFSSCRLCRSALNNLWLAFVIGVFPVFFLAAYQTATGDVVYGTESLLISSGGFGPNQVSAVLGLGAVFGLIYVVDNAKASRFRRWLIIGISSAYLFQAALTFSRGGIYAAAGALLSFLFYTGKRKDRHGRAARMVALVLALAVMIFVPTLMRITKGAILDRYSEHDVTGRNELANIDIQLFRDNIWFGAGVGTSGLYHERGIATHTEMTRLLAEHGIFGAAALMILMYMASTCWYRVPTESRGYVAGWLVWSLTFMMAYAMRLAAPGVVFGMAFTAAASRYGTLGSTDSRTPTAQWGRRLSNNPETPGS